MTNVALAIKNEKTQKVLEEAIGGVPGFAYKSYDPRASFDILILEVHDEFQKELEHIKIIQLCLKRTMYMFSCTLRLS